MPRCVIRRRRPRRDSRRQTAPAERGGGGRGGGRGGGARGARRSTKRRGSTSRSRCRRTSRTGTVVLRGARILTMKGQRSHSEGRHRREGQPHRRRRAAGEGADPVGREGDRRRRQDDPAGLRRRARAHLAGVRHPPLAAVRVSRQPRVRRDDDARSADVDHRRPLVRRPGGDRRVRRPAHLRRPVRASSRRRNIRTLDDARDVLKRYSEFYNTETIKQYMSGDRRTRQWVIMAAREQGSDADARGRPRLQEEHDRGDGRLHGHRAYAADRAALQGRRAAARGVAARRGRRRSSCSTAARGPRTTGTRTTTS